MAITMELSRDTLGPAFAAWERHAREVRGKGAMEVVERAMQYAVSFAMAEIEEKKPGDAAKVERQLTALSHDTNRVATSQRARLRGGRRGAQWRNTVAARIVFMLNYQQARTKAAFGDDAGAYASVGKFVAARKYSVRHHKVSGFLPALVELAKGRRSMLGDAKGPRYRNKPGEIVKKQSPEVAEIIVSAWPSAAHRPGSPKPLGLAGLVPEAFTARMDQVRELFLRFVIEDGLLSEAARMAGFKVTGFGENTFGQRATPTFNA